MHECLAYVHIHQVYTRLCLTYVHICQVYACFVGCIATYSEYMRLDYIYLEYKCLCLARLCMSVFVSVVGSYISDLFSFLFGRLSTFHDSFVLNVYSGVCF